MVIFLDAGVALPVGGNARIQKKISKKLSGTLV